MSRPPMAVEAGVTLKDAWEMMRREQIKALPVVDATGQVQGIITMANFMRLAKLDMHGIGAAIAISGSGPLGSACAGGRHHESRGPGRAGPAARDGSGAAFSRGGHHHIPIVDAKLRLAGVITQTDLVRAGIGVASGRDG